MKLASELFSEQDRREIEAAVAAAEEKTAAEIVPVVATVSGRYDRAESLVGVTLALTALTLIWLLFQDVELVQGDWAAEYRLTIGLGAVLAIVVVGYIAGVLLAVFLPGVRRLFIGRREMTAEVAEKAAAAFYQNRVHRTAAGTGLIIYISLYERMVHILGDETISEKLTQADWEMARDLVVAGLREDRPAAGLKEAISHCGELLHQHFPITVGDRNELVNELLLID